MHQVSISMGRSLQDRFLQRRAGASPSPRKRPGPLLAMGQQAPGRARKRLAAASSLGIQGRAQQGLSFQALAAESGNTSDEGETLILHAQESRPIATTSNLRYGSGVQREGSLGTCQSPCIEQVVHAALSRSCACAFMHLCHAL